MTLPLSICSDSFGITTLVTAMLSGPVGVADTPDRVRDLLFGRRLQALELRAYGIGACAPVTRSTGASRSSRLPR